MSVREEFRGNYRDRVVIKPIDPERPHRFVEVEVGRKGTCVICWRRKRSDYHDDAARQHTVAFRDPSEAPPNPE